MNSYSQVGQDLFVLQQTQNKRNGVFLDIGCAHPVEINNTFLLESEYDWTGACIDFDTRHNEVWKNRKAMFINQDALTIDYDALIGSIAVDGVVDYLSLDLEPPSITHDCLFKIPFDKYKITVITYEHDRYRAGDEYRNSSREYLISKGYRMVQADVKCSGAEFEDWYVLNEFYNG
jgi:hypothetical protein